MEVSFEYWNKLADQTVVISSLLAGFSITVIANIIVSKSNTRISNIILGISTLAACLFLISIFAMTLVLLKTTPGYPFEVEEIEFRQARVIGSLTFFLGIASLIAMISLSGWTKSKKMGWLTTVLGIVTSILVIIVLN
ncbi:MAG: hypothetical protein AAF696_12910 [Bacteroidota bacterium]